MSTLRRSAAAATDLVRLAAGRAPGRAGSPLCSQAARLGVPNDLHTNGGSSRQRWVLDMSPPGRDVHVIDVGANVGRWSVAMLTAAQEAGRSGDLDPHAFEPSAYAFERLEATLHGQQASLQRMALSDTAGSSLLHVRAPGAGTNSLHTLPGVSPAARPNDRK